MNRILIAPDFANLAESHRMVSFVKAFCKKKWEVFVMGKGTYDYLLEDYPIKRVYVAYDEEWFTPEKYVTMHSIDEEGFDYFTVDDLSRFVEEEKVIVSKVNPDIILTGYRLTISLTARVLKIPFVWLLSAVLSDMYFEKRLATMPHGCKIQSQLLKSLNEKQINEFFCKKIINTNLKSKNWSKYAKNIGIKPFKNDMEIFRGDYNIMADCPFLFPEFGQIMPYYSFCGPLLLDYKNEIPKSVLNYKKGDKKTIFFSMGSSGNPVLFKEMINKLCKQTKYDIFIAISSLATREEIGEVPPNVIIEKMFPIPVVAAISDVAITHGGQGTLYSIIIKGLPFIGVPSFCEQQYNLETFARAGCGRVLQKDSSFDEIMSAVKEVLDNSNYKQNAVKVGNQINEYLDNLKVSPGERGADGIIEFLEKYKENKNISYFSR
ncbi:glycosyltransferase [Clostridium felsineum]|uniref:PGL/p-HBAD biosynthesis glycosyltransferase n=1 Tax=Clostridium felsineum TaxID=36839 RepID=A0A1S8KY23_9CLOT|nr:nucleotide disphospho-sugar-binding domain-containing protein [Clostridium felsineum]URZ05469.1 PGL/p-HBAD biosynthesis glycosyltransferase [Clostridium felsineum]URZ10509.1 PGL/p-HBAD biosynthesis glycosyltransferase [Clostridium felsineum]